MSGEPKPDRPERLKFWFEGQVLAEWYSVNIDAGLFYGDQMIEESNGALRWAMRTLKSGLSYQRTVVEGFDSRSNPVMDIPVELRYHGQRMVLGDPVSSTCLVDYLAKMRKRIPDV